MDESQTPPTPEQPQEPTPAPEQTLPVDTPTEAPAEAPLETPSPSPFGAPIDTQTTPPKKSKKPLIIIASVVGGLIVVAAIALAIYFLFFAVTTKDYQTALTTGNAVVTKAEASETALGNLSLSTSTDNLTDVDKQITTAQNALGDFKKSNATLANLKALHNKDVKAKYDTYITKYNAYATYVSNFLASYKLVAPAMVAMGNISDDTDFNTAVTDLQTAQKAYDSAKSAPDKDFSAYANSISSALQDAITAAQKAKAAQASGDQDAYFDATDDYSTATEKVDDATDTFSTNIEKHAESIDPSSAYNAFIQEISSKIK